MLKPLVVSFPIAIQFQQEQDWAKVRSACHQMAVETWKRINQLTGIAPLHSDPDTWFAQMIVASLPADADLITLEQRLYDDYPIKIPLIGWNEKKLIRLSVQGYNLRRDMDKLLNALRVLLDRN